MLALWLLLGLAAAVWLLRSLAHHQRLENVMWLRAGKDSELLVNGLAMAADAAARLLLSLTAAALCTLAGGLALARGWLGPPRDYKVDLAPVADSGPARSVALHGPPPDSSSFVRRGGPAAGVPSAAAGRPA